MNENLSDKQIQMIEALCTSCSVQEAAARVGVHPNSVSRWKRSAEFHHAYQRARSEVLAGTTAKLLAVGEKVVESLTSVALDPTAAPTARVSASRVLLTVAYRGVELEDFTKRLDELEEALRSVTAGASGRNDPAGSVAS